MRMKRSKIFQKAHSRLAPSNGSVTRSLERYRMSRDVDRDCRSPRPAAIGRSPGNLLCFVFLLIQLGKSSGDFHLAISTGPVIIARGYFSLSPSPTPFHPRHCSAPVELLYSRRPAPVLHSRVSVIRTLVSGLHFSPTRYAIRPLHSSLDS